MPASATPICSPIEARIRAERIFARLMAGPPVRAIAASETLSVRRVQQIVRERLNRRNSNPADDFALLQIESGRSISSAPSSTPASRRRRTPSSASSSR